MAEKEERSGMKKVKSSSKKRARAWKTEAAIYDRFCIRHDKACRMNQCPIKKVVKKENDTRFIYFGGQENCFDGWSRYRVR